MSWQSFLEERTVLLDVVLEDVFHVPENVAHVEDVLGVDVVKLFSPAKMIRTSKLVRLRT